MYVSLIKKMPYGMHEKIHGYCHGYDSGSDAFSHLINGCRDEYPEYFKEVEVLNSVSENLESDSELAPVAVAAGGLVVGYGMAMARKIYDDHYSDSSKKTAELAKINNHNLEFSAGIPESISNRFRDAVIKASTSNEGMTVNNSLEVAQPIFDQLLPDWKTRRWDDNWMGPLSRKDLLNSKYEIAPAIAFVGSAIVGAAIADKTYDKIIDGVTKYMTGK